VRIGFPLEVDLLDAGLWAKVRRFAKDGKALIFLGFERSIKVLIIPKFYWANIGR